MTPESQVPGAGSGGEFQRRVHAWLLECFGSQIASDKVERIDRFTEEAMELAQSLGYSRERAHALIDYVFDRPTGEPSQELGGVMVTLAALCPAHGLDMHAAAERELARITQPEVIAKIRAKQAAKPTGSALPIATPPAAEGCVERVATAKRYAEYLRLIAQQRSTISNRKLNDIADFLTASLAVAPVAQQGAAELERVRAVALAEARRTVAAQDESLHYQRRVVAFVEAAGRAHSLLRYPYHSAEDRAEAVDLLRLVLEGGEPSLSLTRAQFVAWADGAGFDTRTFENSPDFKERTTALAFEGWVARGAFAPTAQPSETVTYSSTQATNCAGCGQHKHTPLRVDAMGGYVCLTCIDAKLEALLESEGGGQEGGEDRHALARRVWEALDRKSCPGVYMQIAYETIAGSTTAPAPVEGGR
jgi:hypothetical protein